MMTMEKLWIQIFQSKATILDKIDQQSRLFDQNLAAKLRIDGITPPPWLLNSDHLARTELNTEDLLSEVLLSREHSAIPFSFSYHPVFEEPVAKAANGDLSNGLSKEECAQNDYLDASGDDSALPSDLVGNAGFAAVGVSALDHCVTNLQVQTFEDDDSITSPQDLRETVNSDMNHEVARSLARLQRSKSRQKAFELRSNSKVAKCQLDEENSQSGSSGGVKEFAIQDDRLEELRSANPLSAKNVIPDAENIDLDGYRSKEKSVSKSIKSKGNDRRQSDLTLDSSSNVGREDAILPDAMVQSIQQSTDVGKDNRNGVGRGIGSRRITRSTSSRQQNTLKGKLLMVDDSRESHKESDIHNQRRLQLLVNVKEESFGQNMKQGTVGYSGRITRSRVSQQSVSSPMKRKLELSVVVGKGNSTNEKSVEALLSNVNDLVVTEPSFATSDRSQRCESTKEPAGMSLLIEQHEEPCVANSTDISDKEDAVVEYAGEKTRTEPASIAETTSNLAASQNCGRRFTRSLTATSYKALETKSSNGCSNNGHENVPDIDMKEQPCTSTNEASFPEGATSTFIGCDDGAGAAGLEVSASCSANSSMPIEPRQLNFDKLEMFSFGGISAAPCSVETAGRSVEKSPSTLLETASEMAYGMSNNLLENNTSLLKEKDDLSTEEPRTDFPDAVEDTDTDIVAVNEDCVALAEEISHAETTIVAHQFQQSHENTKDSSMTGKNLLSSDTEAGTPEAEGPAKSVPTDSITEPLQSVNHDLLKEANDLLNTIPDIMGNQDESRKRLPKERSSCGDANVSCSQLAQSHITAKSIGKLDFCSPVEGSLVRSKRRRIGTMEGHGSSPGMKENSVGQLDKDSKTRDFLNDHSSVDPQTSEELHIPEDDVVQLIGGSQVEERQSLVEYNVQEGPDLQSQEGLEETSTSSGVRMAAEDSDCNLNDEARKSNHIIIVDNVEWKTILERNGNSSHCENEFQCTNVELLPCGEAVPLERNPDLDESVNCTFSSLDSHHSAADDTLPQLEGFILQSDDEQLCSVDEISFENLSLPDSAIERASVLEQLCKSACMKTPVTCSSTPYKLHEFSNLYQSVPTGLLEGMDIKNKHLIDEESIQALQGGARPHSDSFQSLTVAHDWDIKKPCLSPVRKVWDRVISKSSSSEKRRSLNHELPSIHEESENIEEAAEIYKEDIVSDTVVSSVKRKPLAGIDENCPEFESEPYADRFSIDSINTEFSFNGTNNRNKTNAETGKSNRKRYNKENEIPSLGAASRKGNNSMHNRFSKQKLSAKTSSKTGAPSLAVTEPKRNNIVSNVTSFIPLVQQKQAAAVPTGKRDVKVKALEAAEAAKRLAEKKENERKIKKEAMKLERARQEQENVKQLELKKKIKEEERKRKEADMAAKKRQREEDEKKDKERKRLRVEETRKQQKENERKLQLAKEEKDKLRSSVVTNLDNPKRTESLVASPVEEPSYDISPYKCSDDEDEDEDDERPNTKFMPSWASKNEIASAISSQDSESLRAIFHTKSFRSIDEVLLPRKFRIK